MLELKAAPENMEVTGYVRSRTFLNTDVISCRGATSMSRKSILTFDLLINTDGSAFCPNRSVDRKALCENR